MKEKILILNGSHSEISIINAAIKMNFYVITAGSKKDAPGNSLAHEYVNIDYTDTKSLSEYCKKSNITKIIPNANDFGISTFTVLKKELKLNYFDSVENLEIIHNKKLFKNLCTKLKITVPKNYKQNEIEFPCIIKPSDNCGGRGITVLRDKTNLEQAIRYAKANSFNKNIIIEDYIESGLYSFSTFIKNKKVEVFYDDREFTNINPYSVTLSQHPSKLNEITLKSLIISIEKIAVYLDLSDGIFHLQFMVRGDTPYILEATRRMSGDLYARPVESVTKLEWSRLYLQGILNLKTDNNLKNKNEGSFGRLCLLAPSNGTIEEIIIDEKLEKITIEKFNALERGGKVTSHNSQRVAVFIINFSLNPNLSIEEIETLYKIKMETD